MQLLRQIQEPAVLALGRFWSAWPLHPLTNRSSSCHRMAGACSAKVLIATADRRVISRPRVRQSAPSAGRECMATSAVALAACLQPRSSLPRPIGVCRGRECGNQQPSHVISSSLHVVHVVHASGAYQQAAGAPMSPTAALHQPRPSAISSPDSAISSARHVMSGHRRRHDHLAQYRRS